MKRFLTFTRKLKLTWWLVPCLLLQILLILAPSSVGIWISEVLYTPFFIISLIWLISLSYVEIRINKPSQGLLGLPVGVFTIFSVIIVYPIFGWLLSLMPYLSSVQQITDIYSDNGEKHILVLIGEGNRFHHKFTGGYLNCTVSSHEANHKYGFNQLAFHPIRWGNYGEQHLPKGSYKSLKKQISIKGISDERNAQSAKAIWTLLQQAENGETLAYKQVDVVIRPLDNNINMRGFRVHIFLIMIFVSSMFIWIDVNRYKKLHLSVIE